MAQDSIHTTPAYDTAVCGTIDALAKCYAADLAMDPRYVFEREQVASNVIPTVDGSVLHLSVYDAFIDNLVAIKKKLPLPYPMPLNLALVFARITHKRFITDGGILEIKSCSEDVVTSLRSGVAAELKSNVTNKLFGSTGKYAVMGRKMITGKDYIARSEYRKMKFFGLEETDDGFKRVKQNIDINTYAVGLQTVVDGVPQFYRPVTMPANIASVLAGIEVLFPPLGLEDSDATRFSSMVTTQQFPRIKLPFGMNPTALVHHKAAQLFHTLSAEGEEAIPAVASYITLEIDPLKYEKSLVGLYERIRSSNSSEMFAVKSPPTPQEMNILALVQFCTIQPEFIFSQLLQSYTGANWLDPFAVKFICETVKLMVKHREIPVATSLSESNLIDRPSDLVDNAHENYKHGILRVVSLFSDRMNTNYSGSPITREESLSGTLPFSSVPQMLANIAYLAHESNGNRQEPEVALQAIQLDLRALRNILNEAYSIMPGQATAPLVSYESAKTVGSDQFCVKQTRTCGSVINPNLLIQASVSVDNSNAGSPWAYLDTGDAGMDGLVSRIIPRQKANEIYNANYDDGSLTAEGAPEPILSEEAFDTYVADGDNRVTVVPGTTFRCRTGQILGFAPGRDRISYIGVVQDVYRDMFDLPQATGFFYVSYSRYGATSSHTMQHLNQALTKSSIARDLTNGVDRNAQNLRKQGFFVVERGNRSHFTSGLASLTTIYGEKQLTSDQKTISAIQRHNGDGFLSGLGGILKGVTGGVGGIVDLVGNVVSTVFPPAAPIVQIGRGLLKDLGIVP